jgi:hypothetical protein
MHAKRMLGATLVAGMMTLSAPARAEGPGLHYAHAGAMLSYAEAEVKLLFGAINAAEFDPAMTRALLDELKRLLEESKRRIDRASALLDEKDAKLEPELVKVRDALKKAEGSLEALGRDIEAQTGGAASGEEGSGPAVEKKGGDAEEEGEAAPRDWELLKRGAGWLGADLKDAQAAYGAVARKLKLPALPFPPKPKQPRG